jgi:CRP/FNR family transcriptional regulator, cyclic AMP receptor protein
MRVLRETDPTECEIFTALGSLDKDRLRPLFRPRSYQKNETIFIKGEPGNGLWLIRNGRIKICVIDHQGTELIFTFLGKGDLMGDLAIIDGKPRSATAVSVENTDTFYLDRRDFLKFLSTSPQACMDIINMLCQRLRRLSGQLEEMLFLGVAGRIAKNLIKLAEKDLPAKGNPTNVKCSITQEELARLIGASREMVNKVLNSFVDMGLISITRKKLTILNSLELRRLADYDGKI